VTAATKRVLRLGLLGTGLAARKLYLPALARIRGRVRVVACASRTLAKAEAFARDAQVPLVVDGLDALLALPEVDALLVSLPIEAQPAVVLKALRAGKPVLSEKPMAPSLAAGRRLLAQARPLARRGPAWMVGENYRFMPAAAWAEKQLRQGALGQLRVVEVRQSGWTDASNPYFHTAWRTRPRFVGGFVLDAGVHLAHLVRRFAGFPVELRGLAAQFSPDLPPMDTAVAVLRFSNGALGTWLSSFSSAAGGPMLTLRGSLGSLELHPDHALLIPRRGRPRGFRSKDDSFSLQFGHFAGVVLDGRRSAYTAEDALLDLALMESVVRGRIVRP
jgi:predicted dehydrogenase